MLIESLKEQWQSLAATIGDPRPETEVRFNTLRGRMRHHDEIDRCIENRTRPLASIDVEARLKSAGVPAERMSRIQDLVEGPDPSRAYLRMAEPRVGSMLTTALPLELSRSSLAPASPAPRLGEHTREVLSEWLDLSAGELAELERDGALV